MPEKPDTINLSGPLVPKSNGQAATPNRPCLDHYRFGRSLILPYLVTYNRRTDRDGQERAFFQWRPHYRAEGVLTYGACESLIAVLDFDGNDFFDEEDFTRGTTINLDIDNDGRIGGKKEWLRGDQIIEFCGNRFLLDELALDGSYMILKETELPVPEIGKPVPSFTVRTRDGTVISSDELKGTNYLLDFWASWCAPCVGKFPFLQALEKELQGSIQIIAVNVDEPADLDAAKEVLMEYRLSWPHVMNGKGTSDPLWKMFGSMAENRLSIPLYVLVNREGAIFYADSGGAELEELAAAMRSMLEGQNTR